MALSVLPVEAQGLQPRALAAAAGEAGGRTDELQRCVERARQGDADAFGQLVELTHARLYRLALHLLGDADEAEDATQDAFVRAWGRLGQLQQAAAVLPWLSRILRNAARDRQRWWRRRRAVRLDEGLAPLAEQLAQRGEQELPGDALLAAELGAAVQRATQALPEKLRVSLLLREVEGMAYEEIAALLEVPVGTVESRVHRARRTMAHRLERLVRPGGEG